MNHLENIDENDEALVTECRRVVEQQEMTRLCRPAFLLLFIMGSLPVVIILAYSLIKSGSVDIDWRFLVDPGVGSLIVFGLWWLSAALAWLSKYGKLCRLVVKLERGLEGCVSKGNDSPASAPQVNLFAESAPRA
jgi:hypothetical protein